MERGEPLPGPSPGAAGAKITSQGHSARARGMPECGERARRAPGARCGWRRRAARSRAASCRSSRCCTPLRRRPPPAPSTRRSSPPWSAAGSTRPPAAPCSPARAPGSLTLMTTRVGRPADLPAAHPPGAPRSRRPHLCKAVKLGRTGLGSHTQFAEASMAPCMDPQAGLGT